MIGLDDVGVNEVGDELGLADKILNEHLLARKVGPDDLDGDPLYKLASPLLLSLIYNPHAAFKYLADNLVAKTALDGEQCHNRMFGKCGFKSSPGHQTPEKYIIFLSFLLARFR